MKTLDYWLGEAKTYKMNISNRDEDYLVKDHNPKTLGLFKKQGYYNLLLKARNEILVELDKLEHLGEPREHFEIIEVPANELQESPYTRSLAAYTLSQNDLFEAGGFKHTLFRYLSPISIFKSAISRFQEEKDLLNQKLPCLESNSIFVVTDCERWDLLRVLITGPSCTDYANGMYMFDVVCTSNYPQSPPQVLLLTNGRCKVKFHKNLTETGEVIVPLLTKGTWKPNHHLIDLLLEIQDLFRTSYKTESNNEEDLIKSRTAQAIIRYNNLCYAMIDMINHPPNEFADLVPLHFEMKKKEILKDLGDWISDAPALVPQNDELLSNPHTVQLFTQEGYSNLLQIVNQEISSILDDFGEGGSENSYCEEENFSDEAESANAEENDLSSSSSEEEYKDKEEYIPPKSVLYIGGAQTKTTNQENLIKNGDLLIKTSKNP